MLRVHAVQDLCFRGRTTDAKSYRDVRGLVLEWVACLGFCRDRDVKLRRECRRRGPWSTRTRRRGHRATPAAESDACRQRGGESRQRHASTRQQPAGSCPQAAARRQQQHVARGAGVRGARKARGAEPRTHVRAAPDSLARTAIAAVADCVKKPGCRGRHRVHQRNRSPAIAPRPHWCSLL